MANWRDEAADRNMRKLVYVRGMGARRRHVQPIVTPEHYQAVVAAEEMINKPKIIMENSRGEPHSSEKVSLGIACCRVNEQNRMEILLVCKRITYAYNLFVHGRYNSGSTHELLRLFSNMTLDEKLDILSLNFMQIWYRIWLNSTHASTFFSAKNKFETTFAVDGGVRLRKLIAKSGSINRIWEIPKGRKKKSSEPDINCAVREFQEETGMSLSNYKLFPWARRSYSYVDGKTKYTNTYFIGYAPHADAKINFSLGDQVAELSDIQWMSMEAIRVVDPTGKLEKFVKPIFKFVKKQLK